MPMDYSDETLVHQYNISLRVDELKRTLLRYNLMDPFLLYIPEPDIPNVPQRRRIDLIVNVGQVTEVVVITSNKFLILYGQDYDLQNLELSYDLFESTCETGLRDKITEKTLGIPQA